MKNPQFWQVSEIVVSYRNQLQVADRPKIVSSRDAENVFRANWSDNIELLEEFNMLLLSRANLVKGLFRVSKGGTSGTVVDAKIIFSVALKAMAASIILAHNHPSGALIPSNADIELTRKLREAGVLLDLPVLDHLILAPYIGYYSFADEGLL